MKTKRLWLILPLLAALFGMGCKKDPEKGLTKATQIGANTFSCKVNGEIFIPKLNLFGGTPLYAQIDSFNDTETLLIGASNENTIISNFHFSIRSFHGIGDYPINEQNEVECYLNNVFPDRALVKNGFIHITKYSSDIVSGTYEFSFTHQNISYTVALGRFDLKLRNNNPSTIQ